MSQLVVFEINHHQLALKVQNVVEIIRAVAVTLIPETRLPFVGVINYRGQILPVLQVAALLNLVSDLPEVNSQMIVVNDSASSRSLCLAVDQVIGFTHADQLLPLAQVGKLTAQAGLTPELAGVGSALLPVLSLAALLEQFDSSLQITELLQQPEQLTFSEN